MEICARQVRCFIIYLNFTSNHIVVFWYLEYMYLFPLQGSGVQTPGAYLSHSYTLDTHTCMGLYDDRPPPVDPLAEIQLYLSGEDEVWFPEMSGSVKLTIIW